MKHYRFVDWATQLYLVLVAGLALFFHGDRVPGWGWLLAAHATVMALIHVLVSRHAAGRGGPVLAFLRSYYPILLYTGFYRETGLLNHLFVSEYMDPVFMRIDLAWFGHQPSLTWMEWFPQRWVAELLYGCYFSYYLMIAGVGLWLYVRNRRAFAHFVAVVSFTFYLCYLTYICLPVMGPRIYFDEEAGQGFGGGQLTTVLPPDLVPEKAPVFPESVQSAFFYRLVIWIYRHFEAPGAAFPSSHVALSLATVFFSWKYIRRIRWIHASVAFGLCVATVYCRYHYVVDVAAGALTTALLVPIGNWLYRRVDGPPANDADHAETGRS